MRYCPSIEDKINRFADKDSHQIFLEPEGLTTHEIYPNGISTSLPFDVQIAAVRSMGPGAGAHILRPGYAIEYDYFDPRELRPSFETQAMAACSSPARSMAPPATKRPPPGDCLAGANAALQVLGEQPGCRLGTNLPGRAGRRPRPQRRDRAVSHVHQPGRVPAAAARRTTPTCASPKLGRRLGLVDDERWAAFERPSASGSKPSCSACAAPGSALRPCPQPTRKPTWASRSNTSTAWPTLLRRPGVLAHDNVSALDALAHPGCVSRETMRREWGERETDAVIDRKPRSR